MSIIGIEKAEFELTTLQGRREALKKLQALGLELTAKEIPEGSDPDVEEFLSLLDEPLREEDEEHQQETVLDRVKALRNILREIINKDEFIVPRSPEIVAWDDITVEPREWLIPHWLPANTATLFTGDGGAGKSWLTLQVVCQIACGFTDAFLDPDFQLPSDADDSVVPKDIVLATYEDEPAEIKRRIQALASGMNWIEASLNTIQQHLHIVDMRGIGSVWGPGLDKHVSVTGYLLNAGQELQAICEDKHARLLVMDPLSGAFGGNENDRTAVYDFVSSFRGWGDTANCAMLAIGHLPKGAEGRAAGFSGSTAWEASARSMWMLTKKEESYWVLQQTKSNYAPLQTEKCLAKQKSGWWREVETDDEAKAAYQEYQDNLNGGTPETDEDYINL